MSANGSAAKVLVFGDEQIREDSTHGGTRTSPVVLCATVRRNGDAYLISDLIENASAGLPPGGPQLPAAAEAARAAVNTVADVVTAVAVEPAGTDLATLLIAADAGRNSIGSGAPAGTPRRYEVTVRRSATGWTAGPIDPVR